MSNTTPTPIGNEAETREETAGKPAVLAGWEPAPEIESYDDVAWFRKTWFVFFPLFVPAALVIALTGDVYGTANGTMKKYSEAQVWRCTTACRAFVILLSLIVIVALVSAR